MSKGDIFPILKSMLTPGEGSASSQVVAEDTEGDQPPLSPSLLTDSATPDGLVTPDRDGRTEGKAWHLSQEERAEVGLSPSWDSDPNLMREKERRSKSNMDRPSLVRGVEGKEVAIQLVFEEGEQQGNAEAKGSKPMTGAVIGELAAQVARAPRTKSKSGGPSRFSRRGATASAEPVLQRAIARAQKNVPGTSHSPNPKSLSRFAVLPNVSDEHLLTVAKDSCIVFPSAAGNPAPLLSIIRAKELAQADLALARDRLAAEQAAAREAEGKEDTQELAEATGVASQETALASESSGGRKKKEVLAVRKKRVYKKTAAIGTRVLTRQARGRKNGAQ
jgi:hypothetical protein